MSTPGSTFQKVRNFQLQQLTDHRRAGFAGSLLLSNLWSIAHDETKYPDPEKFFPERFLAEDGSITPNDVEHLAFGFGRRICPGRHFADASVWSVIANVLAVFSISKSKDANGMEIPVEPKFSSGITM